LAAQATAPTASPSLYPTWSPGALPPCPPRYDTLATYVAGNAIEMNLHMFVCQAGEFAEFCSIVEMDEGWDEVTQALWKGAWDHVGACTVSEVVEGDVDIAASEAVEDAEAIEAAEAAEATVAVEATGGTGATDNIAPVEVAETADAHEDEDLEAAEASETTHANEEIKASEAGPALEAVGPATSSTPTIIPVVTLPPCPQQYDHSATYTAGAFIEVSNFVFQCNTDDEVYEMYCNIPEWTDDLTQGNGNALELWNLAWVPMGPCAVALVEESDRGD